MALNVKTFFYKKTEKNNETKKVYLLGLFKKKKSKFLTRYYLLGVLIWKKQDSFEKIISYFAENAKYQLQQHLNQEIPKLNNNLENAFQSSNNNLENKLQILNNDLENSFQNLNNNLENRFQNLNNDLENRFQNLNNNLENRFQNLKNNLESNKKEIELYSNITNSIEFNNVKNRLFFESDGNYEPESFGMWLKEEFNLYLCFYENNPLITLDLEFVKFLPKEAITAYSIKEPVFHFFINNILYQSISLNNLESSYHIKINKDELLYLNGVQNCLCLSILSTNCKSPYDLGISIDGRVICLGLCSIHSNVKMSTSNIALFQFANKKIECTFNNGLWNNYFQTENLPQRIKYLKDNLDDKSCSTVDELIKRRNNPYKFTLKEIYNNCVCQQYNDKYFISMKTGFQPQVFYFKNGLKYLPSNIIEKHLSGKCVIDGGACSGDSAIMFSEYNFIDKVYSFEPLSEFFKNMKITIDENHCSNVIPVQQGLGGKTCKETILGELCEVTTIDDFAQKNNKTIGCIKLDIEGMEFETIKGAIETIKRDKPLLLICLYHTPKDFFEIKPLIEKLNLGYKFKIVDTEPCNASVGIHVTLLAYKE